MTLDIAKFISNSIRTQAKIQHLDVKVKTNSLNKIPQSVSKIISKEYGDKYLLDADYVSFFWGQISKDDIKRLFNVVDKALGKSANKLTDTDFKKISLKDDENKDPEVENADDKDEASEENDQDDEEKEEASNDEYEKEDEAKEVEDEVDEVLKEDEEPTSTGPTAYFFLKITLK